MAATKQKKKRWKRTGNLLVRMDRTLYEAFRDATKRADSSMAREARVLIADWVKNGTYRTNTL